MIYGVRSVHRQWHDIKKSKYFVTLGKAQFKVEVNIEKNIYIIPAKHSVEYHYLSSIDICGVCIVVPIKAWRSVGGQTDKSR